MERPRHSRHRSIVLTYSTRVALRHLADRNVHRLGDGDRVAGCPNHEMTDAILRLRRRHVDVQPSIVDAAVPHVSDDADDRLHRELARLGSAGGNRHALAHGVLARPQTPRRAVTYDRDARSVLRIARREEPAAAQSDAHCLEVAGRNRLKIQVRVVFPALGDVDTLPLQQVTRIKTEGPLSERSQEHRAHCLHGGQRGTRVDDRVVRQTVFSIGLHLWLYVERQDVLRLETKIDLPKLVEAAHEEPGAGEKDRRERNLNGCQDASSDQRTRTVAGSCAPALPVLRAPMPEWQESERTEAW